MSDRAQATDDSSSSTDPSRTPELPPAAAALRDAVQAYFRSARPDAAPSPEDRYGLDDHLDLHL